MVNYTQRIPACAKFVLKFDHVESSLRRCYQHSQNDIFVVDGFNHHLVEHGDFTGPDKQERCCAISPAWFMSDWASGPFLVGFT